MPMTHPINPVDADGQPVDRKGNKCSTHEPPPKGFVQCPCSRYSGEGFGTQCGLTAADDYLWEIGTACKYLIWSFYDSESSTIFRCDTPTVLFVPPATASPTLQTRSTYLSAARMAPA